LATIIAWRNKQPRRVAPLALDAINGGSASALIAPSPSRHQRDNSVAAGNDSGIAYRGSLGDNRGRS